MLEDPHKRAGEPAGSPSRAQSARRPFHHGRRWTLRAWFNCVESGSRWSFCL